jgi:hypothetical protein
METKNEGAKILKESDIYAQLFNNNLAAYCRRVADIRYVDRQLLLIKDPKDKRIPEYEATKATSVLERNNFTVNGEILLKLDEEAVAEESKELNKPAPAETTGSQPA